MWNTVLTIAGGVLLAEVIGGSIALAIWWLAFIRPIKKSPPPP